MLKCYHVRRIYFVQSIQKNLTFTCSQNLVCRFIIERQIKHANRFNNAAKQITSSKSKIPQFHQYGHNTCLRILLHRFYKQVSKHHRFTHAAIGNKSYHIGLLSYFIKSSILYHCTSGWHTSSRIRTINSTQCVTDKHILHFAEFIRKISLYLWILCKSFLFIYRKNLFALRVGINILNNLLSTSCSSCDFTKLLTYCYSKKLLINFIDRRNFYSKSVHYCYQGIIV